MLALCSVEDVRAYAGHDPQRADLEALLTRLVNAASSTFTRASGREWKGPGASSARTFSTWGNRSVPIGDASAVTQVELVEFDGTASVLDATSWQALRSAHDRPYTRVRVAQGVSLSDDSALRVTGTWGWAEVPEDVRQAVIEQVRLWLVRDVERQSAGFLAGDDTTRTQTLRALAPSVFDVARDYRHKRAW